MKVYRTKGKRFILIKDETTQDGAGAVLLHRDFTLSRQLDKNQLGRVLYRALDRSAMCVLHSWHAKFEGKLLSQFAKLPAVICMLNSDIRRSITQCPNCCETRDDQQQHTTASKQQRCYMTELLWAIIMVELVDYLQHKRRDTPMLTWIVGLPQWLCKFDAAKVDVEMDRVFALWKSGRNCAKFRTTPCDAQCCCHTVLATGCGCICPCICTCDV